MAAAGGLVILWAYFNYALVPVAKAGANIKPAMQGIGYTHEYLDRAAGYDKLDPTALNLNGRFYVQEYNQAVKKQAVLLEKAAQCFLEAVRRDNADFKNYEKLSQVYNLLGDNKTAYRWALEAAKRYPGSDRLQFNLGNIAEQLNAIPDAVEHYKKAVKIEDQFRAQFRQMYPRREIVSRLGEEKYQFALERIRELEKQQKQD
jgi:tetratricopeptide (TPR) repeat protein